ncbi:hypothetical protein [Phenylobacterium sp.]|uniref:hypothetical protein n=1 Tax=Phenylobacterium sp. TaxID=1871053 RepID=UPI00286BC33C|nr:hypothetical protein [Phenylobacterium sp.]
MGRSPPSDPERLSRTSVAFAGLIAVASLAVAILVGAAPRDPAEAAGVFPPWWGRGEVFGAAAEAGAIQAAGSLSFIIIVRAPQGDAAARLRAAGALFSIDPGLARLCGV